MQPPLLPTSGPDYQPVVTLNGWTLPWRMNGDWKEFHLVAEPVVREIAPGMKAHLWGYNGQSPGPTIEAVEGDKVRIFVTNKLPEHTTVHWHGMLLPNGMDGVGGLTQPHIKPGKTFVYEFVLKKSGTFMYHPHADEMVQMAMGMMGFFVVHPRDPNFMRVDRDFVFLLNAYDIDPGSYVPKVMTMTDFNLWTWNSRVFPGIDHLVVRKGDRVRVRVGNLTMTNHPIHMHGYHFEVTCTDGGWVPAERALAGGHDRHSGRRDARLRVRRRRAGRLGDPLPQVASHHECHGPRREDLHRRAASAISPRPIRKLVPDYMAMGSAGMAEMGEMEMPMPDNTLPMMTGFGQFGPMEMGGMFSVVKVREGLARDDYNDPGWYKHPAGHGRLRSRERAAAAPPRQRPPHRPQIRKSKSTSSSPAQGRPPSATTDHKEQSNHVEIAAFLPQPSARRRCIGRGHSPAPATPGHSHASDFRAGEPGNPKKPARIVQVTMREGDGKMMFVPDRVEVKRGEQIRFVLRNNGELDHEFMLATTAENVKHAEEMKKNPDMEHDDPNAKRLAPKKTSEIVWQFTKARQFEFGCLIPGHREAGMTGTVIVK